MAAIDAFRTMWFSPRAAASAGTGSALTNGGALFKYWVLPFEVLSVLLLAALVGAIVLSRADVGILPRQRTGGDGGTR